jgi:hypothetical protein
MREVLANFKGQLRFDVHYIVDENPDGTFRALHGASEVAENIRQLCAKQHYRKGDRYLQYLYCRAKDYTSSDWEACAKDGIAPAVIRGCADGSEGPRLLAADLKHAAALRIAASPTWLANNRHPFSGITAEAIKTAYCVHNRHPGCANTLSDKAASSGACGQ